MISKHIIINDNDYSNPYDENNDNKTKIKQGITKIIKVLLMCMVTKTTVIKSIILIATIMIILVITISNNSNL